MGSQRQYIRINGNSECILMELDGDTYEALLEDISLGGALIKVNNGVPKSLQIGDECNLMLCHNPDLCPSKLSCRVVRHDSDCIGIRFLTNRVQ
jgi:c-di-GMP-binding flagellar brake protein YcgR